MATEGYLEIETVVLVRTLAGGHVTAMPIADPRIVSFGGQAGALRELELFLEKHFLEVDARVLGRFGLPPGSAFRAVRVPFERIDLPAPLRRSWPIDLACVLVPEGRAFWALVPGLDHTVYVPAGAAIDEHVAHDVGRIAAVQSWTRGDFVRWLPVEAELHTLTVLLEHGGEGVSARARTLRAKRLAEHRRQAALDTLARIGTRLERGDARVIGREREEAELSRLLDAAGVVLVGEPAVGKSALMRACVGERPIYATSGAELVAGMSGFGEWQERVGEVLAAAELLGAILYFENLGELLSERPERGGVDIVGALRPYVVEGRVRIAGELTPEAFAIAERRHVSFFGALRVLRLEPLDARETVQALRAHALRWRRPAIAAEVFEPLVALAERYFPYQAFPGKAVRFAEELRTRHEEQAVAEPPAIGLSEMYDAFSLASGIPAFLLRDDRAMRVDQVVRDLTARVVGQPHAVRCVAETLCVVKARLQPADKPLCSFLFIGPTGIGKTELARTTARFLFGDETRMVRFDMSEYADAFAAERLIAGSANAEGLLTSRVRAQPFSVLLLDEIEKAHPAVFDLLLQVLGEGRLSDARGRITYFHNAIIILTSNLGATHRAEKIGWTSAAPADRYLTAVHEAFRPELVNRLDRIVVFEPLSRDELRTIVRSATERLAERRGLQQAGITLELSDRAADRLAEGGYSPDYGVRALRRHLENALITPAAELLARHAAKGALLWVGEPSEPSAASERERMATMERGLRFDVYRRKAATGRQALRGMAAVSAQRREADALMRIEQVEQVEERLAFVRAELATSAKSKLRDREDLLREHHRLAVACEAAERAREELVVAEELCLGALYAGESARAWVDESAELYARLRRCFFYLLVAERRLRDDVTLRVYSLDGSGPFERWLFGFLDAAEARGWTVVVHARGRLPAPDWPAERPWTPPQDARWARRELHHGKYSAVLLRVSGRDAGVLLPFEVGLHRLIDDEDRARHFVVELMALRSELRDEDWKHRLLVTAPPAGSPGRVVAARQRQEDSRELRICDKERVIELAEEDYWSELEKVALEVFLHHIERDTTHALFLEKLIPEV